MGILDEDVTRVRESTDLVAVVSEHVALKRVGQRWTGLCPFHQEKTPSFSVNPTMGVYYCFGCQRSGDAITFVREVEHLDFVEAIERLAQRAGITLRYDDQRTAQDRSRRARLVEATAAAVDFYHRLLLGPDEGGRARKHLRARGFDGDAARRFQLGWAPDDWDRLSRHLQQQRFARDDLVAAGLAFVNRANRLQDQFRGRLLFPIFDARGEPVGFGGRALGDEQPKYKNSPETTIYNKSRLLYGLNWAKGDIVARGEVVICEGYTDVMGLTLAGAPNAVATCGTALADEHFQVLKNLARRVVLAYDADAAGQGAAERWYRWEQEFEIEVRVADLPPGQDPGELFHTDPARLLAAIEQAAPFLQFRLDRAIAGADMTSIEGKARAATTAARMVAEHPNALVRDQYVMRLAGAFDIDADRLREEVRQASQGGRSARRGAEAPAEPPAPARRARPVDRRELDVLRWAMHEPERVADWLDEALFADPVAREAYRRLAESASVVDAIDGSDADVRPILERLAVEPPMGDEEDEEEMQLQHARLLVNAVEPVAHRVLAEQPDADTRDAMRRDLDELAHEREMGEWQGAEETARRLLQWIVLDRGAART